MNNKRSNSWSSQQEFIFFPYLFMHVINHEEKYKKTGCAQSTYYACHGYGPIEQSIKLLAEPSDAHLSKIIYYKWMNDKERCLSKSHVRFEQNTFDRKRNVSGFLHKIYIVVSTFWTAQLNNGLFRLAFVCRDLFDTSRVRWGKKYIYQTYLLSFSSRVMCCCSRLMQLARLLCLANNSLFRELPKTQYNNDEFLKKKLSTNVMRETKYWKSFLNQKCETKMHSFNV